MNVYCMCTKCIVLDLLQYRLSAVLVFQGGSKEIIFISSISYSEVVEQGGCCCHSDSYSKKLGCFWWCCLSWFSNPTVLHHDPGENALCCLLDEGPHTLWKHWEKDYSSHVGRSGMGHWFCKSAVKKGLQFYRCISWVLCLHAVLLIVELPWSWDVLWLISELFNLCKLICVTASAHYWHHQNHCIMDLRMQERRSLVRTHPPFLAKCLSPVTFLRPSCPVQQGPNRMVFQVIACTISYHFNRVTLSLLVINGSLIEKSEPSNF